MHKVEVTRQTYRKGPSHMIFSAHVNGIPLEVSCTLTEFNEQHEETMKKVNENFRNSIRYIKSEGNLPKNPDKKVLNKWTSTNTGVAIKVKSVPVPEFTPFSF